MLTGWGRNVQEREGNMVRPSAGRTEPGSRERNLLLSKFLPSLIYSILHRRSSSRKVNNTKQSQKVLETDHIHWASPSQRCQAAKKTETRKAAWKRVRPESPAKSPWAPLWLVALPASSAVGSRFPALRSCYHAGVALVMQLFLGLLCS